MAPIRTAWLQKHSFLCMFVIGILIWLIFAGITLLGPRCQYEVPNRFCPITLITSLLIVASFLSLLALYFALRLRSDLRDSFVVVVVFAIAFRLVQLFAPPFQEIDLYRYMWDGIVLSEGHSPYRYSPEEVLKKSDKEDTEALAEIKKISLRSESTYKILSRIHFGEYTTIYPPVSQFVFGASMKFVPEKSNVQTYLFVMKTVLTLFDIGTLFLLAYLLALLKLHRGWLVVYAWNPLVIKEISNSGHLDSIAVFFATAGIVCFTRYWLSLRRNHDGSSSPSKASSRNQLSNLSLSPIRSRLLLLCSGALLAFGVSAKIYPIILFPYLVLLVLFRKRWLDGLTFGLSFLLLTSLSILPMLLEMRLAAQDKTTTNSQRVLEEEKQSDNELGFGAPSTERKEGLTSFLKKWQINEFAYMLVYENLKTFPEEKETREENRKVLDYPWFRVTNKTFRDSVNTIGKKLDPENPARPTSRIITLGLFALLYLAVLIWAFYSKSAMSPVTGCFWILAIFFCLQPTQNPWYWVWVTPLLPFARNSGWIWYSPFLFVYYYLFALRTVGGEYSFLGFPYSADYYFHYVLVCLEHFPVYLIVAGVFLLPRFFPNWFERTETVIQCDD